MTVINQVGNLLTGLTGTGKFVGDDTPTLITPVIGAAIGTSLNLGSSTTMTGMIDDDTMATASASLAASSESIVAYIATQIAGAGKIVQYVVATSSTDDTSASTTLANSSLTASITPTNSSNLILINVSASLAFVTGASQTAQYIKWAVYRSTDTPTQLTSDILSGINLASASNGYTIILPASLNVSETAGTTNAHTYFLQFAVGVGTGTAAVRGSTWGPAKITLYELAV